MNEQIEQLENENLEIDIEAILEHVSLLDSQLWTGVGIAVAIFAVFWLFRRIFTTVIYKTLLVYIRKTKFTMDTSILLAFEKPLQNLFTLLWIFISVNYIVGQLDLPVQTAASLTYAVLVFFRIGLIVLFAWGLVNLTGESSTWLERFGQRIGFEIDKILRPLISRILRFIIIALTFTIIAMELGYDVNGFIAGLGLGGLAFALAAQDTIKNFFGGIIIVTEKPFSVGDWIKTPTVEGTVEELTFRSTKIRTFAQGLVTVPNSTLANEAITNWTKMGKRQITFHVGVMYSTPREKLEQCVTRIRNYLRQHQGVHQETLFVHFDRFSSSSLDIFLYFFTKTTVWGEWLVLKEEINLQIMQILEEEGVSIAFPSQSVYFETPLKLSDQQPPQLNSKADN